MPRSSDFLKVKAAAELLGARPNPPWARGGRGKIPEFRRPNKQDRLDLRSDLEAVLGEIEDSRSTAAREGRPNHEASGRAQ
jgi:hypothetical protein